MQRDPSTVAVPPQVIVVSTLFEKMLQVKSLVPCTGIKSIASQFGSYVQIILQVSKL